MLFALQSTLLGGRSVPQLAAFTTLIVPASSSAAVPLSAMGARTGDILVYATGGPSAEVTAPGTSSQVTFNSGSSSGVIGYVILASADIASPPSFTDLSGSGKSVPMDLYRGCSAASIKSSLTVGSSTSIAFSFVVSASHKAAVAISFWAGSVSSLGINNGFSRRTAANGNPLLADRVAYDGTSTTVSDTASAARTLGFVELT